MQYGNTSMLESVNGSVLVQIGNDSDLMGFSTLLGLFTSSN